MNVLLGFLTVIMVLDCILLVFLILLQLPKKEAGAGMAFGGGATDALFGAGSGNVLTKITKYVAGIFFGLALLMAIITANLHRSPGSSLLNALNERPSSSTPAIPPATVPSSNALISPALLSNVPQPQSSAPAKAPPPSPDSATNSAGTPNLLTIPPAAAGTNR
jgi:preprotein translocase subunit SecG